MITTLLQTDAILTPVGTSGAATINGRIGQVNVPAAAASIVITNNLVFPNSIIFATLLTNDSTAQIKNIVPALGSFTVNLAAATVETKLAFFIP